MKKLIFKDFREKYNLKNDTMNESDLQRVFKNNIYPRGSKIYSDKRFVNIDNGSEGGSHWTCFRVKDNESFYFDSFCGQPDTFSRSKLTKTIIYHNYKIQDINSRICVHFAYTFLFT